MFLSRRSSWHSAKEIFSKRFFEGIPLNELNILSTVWEKEAGYLSKHCELIGIEKNALVVRPYSAAASSEIALKGAIIIKEINKYFKKPWLKKIKISSRIGE